MNERGFAAWLKGTALSAGLAGAVLTIGAGAPAALPLMEGPAPATPLLLIEDGPGTGPAPAADGTAASGAAPLAELTEALAAARAKLEQLDRAAGALAGAAALRAELAAKEEENRELLAELQTLRARRAEWQRASEAAQAEIAGLGQALEEAAAEAKELDGELATVRWQNAQLNTSLDRARAGQEAARAETETVRAELAAATSAQEEIATRAAELQAAVDEADSELARARGQLSATAERLSEVNAALSAAEQERDTALADLDEERSRVERLRGALATANADLAATKVANRDLETRLAGLEEAAMLATDAARQNLIAVETQIAALNSTLAEADLGPPGAPATAADDERVPASPSPPDRPAENAHAAANGPAPAAGPTGPADAELAFIKLSEPGGPAVPHSLDALTAELPVESRIQVQSLLADLEAETDRQGIKLMVPGGELFTVNGQEVRDTAHDSLARVAELINLYKGQPVLIIGHTDTIGATDYNQTLSERRAGLVRQFFIDHFDVQAARLSTQGMGEQEPIASNATAAGRRANRRVEVLILN